MKSGKQCKKQCVKQHKLWCIILGSNVYTIDEMQVNIFYVTKIHILIVATAKAVVQWH